MQTQYYKVYFAHQHYYIKKLEPSAEIVRDELKHLDHYILPKCVYYTCHCVRFTLTLLNGKTPSISIRIRIRTTNLRIRILLILGGWHTANFFFLMLITCWRCIYISFYWFKVKRSHKVVEIKVFLTILACRWKDPDPYKIMTDPGGQKHTDPDP